MILLLIPLLVSVVCGANRLQERSLPYSESAATAAQYKFAEEQKYDDTGPGAKGREQAYKTYQTLEDALVAYIDDPDTKLPEHERAKVYNPLNYRHHNIQNFLSREPQYKPVEPQYKPIETQYKPVETQYKPVETQYKPIEQHYKPVQTRFNPFEPKYQLEYASAKPNIQIPIVVNRYSLPDNSVLYHEPESKLGILDLRGYEAKTKLVQELQNQQLTNLQKLQSVTASPLRLPSFMTHEKEGEYDPNPQYSFSYGVHDKHTGDSKSAHEVRDGGNVRGYYTFLDADGKQRTVHYTADDKDGFRATVERTNTNSQG